MDAWTFIEQTKRGDPQPVYVLVGEERFLQRLALETIRDLVFRDNPNDLAYSAYEGDVAKWADVGDELQTLPFLSSRRLVVVQEADGFVTRFREALEKYVQRPSRSGVLVLVVRTWRSNTRLAKLIPDKATIKCEALPAYRLPAWCVQWASRYGKQLTAPAAQLLVEFVGAEMGVLDQELAKLASYVGNASTIEPKDVDALVGHSRVETAWQMLEALGEGKLAAALATLHHLLDQGEEPVAILGAVSWQLRRLAQVAQLQRQGVALPTAMSRVGVPPFAQKRMEEQLRRLGPRAQKLYDWLLEADLGLKTSGGLSPPMVLERLLMRLAGAAPPQGHPRSVRPIT
jgi:DNA polymerase-3 subunit delta